MIERIGQSGKVASLPVLFRSEHELVVVKPAGVASELTSDPRGSSLVSRIQAHEARFENARLPHRLDRVTRGLIVIALTDEAIAHHNEKIRLGLWKKLYLACVHRPDSSRVDDLLGMHRLYLRTRGRQAHVVRSGGRPAWTEVLAAAPVPGRLDRLHLLIQLHTGRMHQIRVTLAHLGTPLVGDWLYGRDGDDERDFYLEHTLLRFAPVDQDSMAIHWQEDPDRPDLAPELWQRLDGIRMEWTRETMDGRPNGEECGDQGTTQRSGDRETAGREAGRRST